MRRLARCLLVAALAAIVSPAAFAREIQERGGEAYPVARALGALDDQDDYARAIEPRVFKFPEDHGAHPAYRTEWWYFTGNLRDPRGRAFGYQLTFFRIALAPRATPSASAWRTNQLYMAHFALADLAGGEFHAFERFERSALGLAAVDNPPLAIRLDGWSAEQTAGDRLALRLRARESGIAIDLQLEAGKPFVLHGDAGLSRKSAEPGNASYYYSAPRMPTAGHVEIDGHRYLTTGASWLDREWSTSALGAGQSGWDWFALQLDDGREIMYYRLRRRDGGIDRYSAGTVIDASGSATHLAAADVRLQARSYWRSPATGVRYPASWIMDLPRYGMRLRIEPALADQELNLTVRYWEGAVAVTGTAPGGALRGTGYVELAGYEPEK